MFVPYGPRGLGSWGAGGLPPGPGRFHWGGLGRLYQKVVQPTSMTDSETRGFVASECLSGKGFDGDNMRVLVGDFSHANSFSFPVEQPDTRTAPYVYI